MSLDLSRALHTAVDGGDDEPLDLDLASIGRQIRRRRHVRAGVRAGVGVAAAGAVALTVPPLIGAQRAGLPAGLPAALSHAGPGECGSRISLLDRPAPAQAGLFTGTNTEGTELGAGELTLSPIGGSLGTYIGDYVSVTAVQQLSASARAQALDAERAQAEARLLALQTELATVTAGSPPPGTLDEQMHSAVASSIQAEISQQQAALDALGSASDEFEQLAGTLAADMQLLVVRAGTVVAEDHMAVTPGAGGYSIDQRTDVVGTRIDQSLRACTEPGRPGGDRLPAGTYDVYVGYAKDGDGVPTKAAGPWKVTVEPLVRAGSLPTGLPAVPLLPGRVDYAKQNGDVWLVNVVAGATDRFDAAGRALVPVAVQKETPTWQTPAGESVLVSDGVAVAVALADGSRWSVTVSAFHTEDGEPSLLYRIAPAS